MPTYTFDVDGTRKVLQEGLDKGNKKYPVFFANDNGAVLTGSFKDSDKTVIYAKGHDPRIDDWMPPADEGRFDIPASKLQPLLDTKRKITAVKIKMTPTHFYISLVESASSVFNVGDNVKFNSNTNNKELVGVEGKIVKVNRTRVEVSHLFTGKNVISSCPISILDKI